MSRLLKLGLTGPGLFRLILALAVVVYHFSSVAIGTGAVDVFFCLSGFWIFKMWDNRYSTTIKPYFTYCVSRAWRLLPTFILITVITILFNKLSFETIKGNSSWLHVLISNFFIFGYNTLSFRPIGPAWSLDIEFQFYIIAPLLCIILVTRTNALFGLILSVIISFFSSFYFGTLSITTFIFFFIAGLSASSLKWEPSLKLSKLGIATLVLLFVGCAITPLKGIVIHGAHPGPLAKYSEAANAIMAILLIPYAIYTTRQKTSSADAMFADLSYIIYLLHWAGARWWGAHKGSFGHRMELAALAWVIIFSVSIFIWFVFDKPINKMRSKWVSSRKQSLQQEVSALNNSTNAASVSS